MKNALLNRREFLVGSVALPFALHAFAETADGPHWVFLGTDKGQGIYRARWDAAAGTLGKVELAVETDRPDFFAKHPKLPILYTVNSVGNGKAGVSAYRVDAASGALTLLNRVSSHGDGPCFVSVEATGQSAFVANYTGGTVAAFGLTPAGALVDNTDAFDCRNNTACGVLGPVKSRQEAAHMHCVTISPGNDFVLTCNLGEDAIEIFPLTPSRTSSEVLGVPKRIPARPGSGPRHVAFHPNGKWLYCIHEIDCSIDLYDWNNGEMTLREGSVVSTLSPGVGLAGNTACEIVVSDDGRYLYSCTRGADEIVVYRIGAAGLLTEQQRLSCGGKVPRYIALDPSRKWLISCNQGAPGSVTVFANDVATGRLSATPKTFAADTAMFVLWV